MKKIEVLIMLLCLSASLAMGDSLDIVLVEDTSSSCRNFEAKFENFKRALITACEPGDHFEKIKNGSQPKVSVSNFVRTKDDCSSILALSLRANYSLLGDYSLSPALELAYLRLLQRLSNGTECKSAIILITDGMISENDAEQIKQLIAQIQSHGISFYVAGTKKMNSVVIRAALEYAAIYSDIDTAQPAIWTEKLRQHVKIQNNQDKKAEIAKLNSEVGKTKERLKSLLEEEQSKKKQLSEIQGVVKRHEIEATSVKGELTRLKQERDVLAKGISDLKEECRQNELKQQAINAKIEESKQNLHQTDNQCDRLKAELSDLKSKQIMMKQEIAQKERILADGNSLAGKQSTTMTQTPVPNQTNTSSVKADTKNSSEKPLKDNQISDCSNSVSWPWVAIPSAIIILIAIGFYSLLNWLKGREFKITIGCISDGRNIANDVRLLPKCEIVPLTGERLESETAKDGQAGYVYIYLDLLGRARLCADSENATTLKLNGESLPCNNVLLNLGDSIEVMLQEGGSLTYILTDICSDTVAESENPIELKVA